MTSNTEDDKDIFLRPDETAAQMITRCQVVPLPTSVEFLDRHAQLRARSVTLLSGLSGTAKSRILMQVDACKTYAHLQLTPSAVRDHS